MMKFKLAVLAVAATLSLSGQAQTEIQWWNSMTAVNGEVVNELAKNFNASQKDYKVVPTYKGNYTESFTAAVAAFRAGTTKGDWYQVSAPVNDEFALWSAAREQLQRAAAQALLVPPEMTGVGDLDAHGSWYESPEYGTIWVPRALPADWAPYRSGRWVWVDPWGWSWVGDEPWGFAPFHYGRWALFRGVWGWVPGKRVARPVYAPSLVAWVGTPAAHRPAHTGGRPAVGWFPLAPREVSISRPTGVVPAMCSGSTRPRSRTSTT